MSNGISHMSHNQSIYANTIALPKMNGSVTTGRGTKARTNRKRPQQHQGFIQHKSRYEPDQDVDHGVVT